MKVADVLAACAGNCQTLTSDLQQPDLLRVVERCRDVCVLLIPPETPEKADVRLMANEDKGPHLIIPASGAQEHDITIHAVLAVYNYLFSPSTAIHSCLSFPNSSSHSHSIYPDPACQTIVHKEMPERLLAQNAPIYPLHLLNHLSGKATAGDTSRVTRACL